jgi:hypothetical protein
VRRKIAQIKQLLSYPRILPGEVNIIIEGVKLARRYGSTE